MDLAVCDEIALELDKRSLKLKGKEVPLRNKEFGLLKYFLSNAGKVLTRSELLERVWDSNIFCSTNTVDVHVSSLRKKFKKHLQNSPIKTIHCVGYMFENV